MVCHEFVIGVWCHSKDVIFLVFGRETFLVIRKARHDLDLNRVKLGSRLMFEFCVVSGRKSVSVPLFHFLVDNILDFYSGINRSLF